MQPKLGEENKKARQSMVIDGLLFVFDLIQEVWVVIAS